MGSVLQIRVDDTTYAASLRVLCAGYESGDWRAHALVDDLFRRHLASFALNYTEFKAIDGTNAAKSLRDAAITVYDTDKYKRRGEFGELILHAALIDFYGAETAVSKIFYKDSHNNTVKGFDSVHFARTGGEWEIWLGEAKFYTDPVAAIREAVASIRQHLQNDFLRNEFLLISRKVDQSWPLADEFIDRLDETRSLDEIIETIVMPILVTYDSAAVDGHSALTDEYLTAIDAEARSLLSTLLDTGLAAETSVRFVLVLVPLQTKKRLLNLMHEKLKVWQHL